MLNRCGSGITLIKHNKELYRLINQSVWFFILKGEPLSYYILIRTKCGSSVLKTLHQSNMIPYL